MSSRLRHSPSYHGERAALDRMMQLRVVVRGLADDLARVRREHAALKRETAALRTENERLMAEAAEARRVPERAA